MLNQSIKDIVVGRILSQVQTPGQYIGGEWNSRPKDHSTVRGKLCLAFPDTYGIGMSNYGLQVLYDAMNSRDDWACERVFTPMEDMERLLREHDAPLYSLETFTPLADFDLLGFTLQYDLCYSNVLTMLDLARIPLDATKRTAEHPLVIGGGPGTANPEPMAKFFDLFVLGDGEEALPQVCEAWLAAKSRGGDSSGDRESMLAEVAARLPFVYVPRFYRPNKDESGRTVGIDPLRDDIPTEIQPAIVADFESTPIPTRPIVPNVECVQDRVAVEIMRGCPGRCRFCQSTTLKRPLRFRKVETIVQAAREAYSATGYNEISLLSLSTSDYPDLEELLTQLQAEFRPKGVSISVPSLRVNEQWRTVADLLNTDRRAGLTLAPEVALDDMRKQIGKRITNDDLYEGCRNAFENGFSRVKLYFMCGLPGEREADLDGIIDMAEHIWRMGRKIRGKPPTVVANVSNFVPKPQTPYQFNAMRRREYFAAARENLYQRKRLRGVQLKCHDIDSSLLEGVICRGDRDVADAIERAWRAGARFDAWSDKLQPELWWQAIEDSGIDVEQLLHTDHPADARLPWDHMQIHQGRRYLQREQERSVEQLGEMEQ